MKKVRPVTPFLWVLFSAGGTIAALLFPVHLFLTGLAFPLGWLEPPATRGCVASWAIP